MPEPNDAPGGAGEYVIDRDEVRAIAGLARLRLEEDEVSTFTRQLNDILGHAREIAAAEEAATGHVATGSAGAEDSGAGAGADGGAGADAGAPTPAAPGAGMRLRPADAPPDPLLAGPEAFAPEFVDGLFAVPRLAAMEEEPAP